MPDPTLERSLAKLTRAVDRLAEALEEPESSRLAIDGTIQRFEFVFELFWKTFRRVLLAEGLDPATPREAIRSASAAGIIEDETVWLALLQARNETPHTYDEEKARAVYSIIRERFPDLQVTLAHVQARVRRADA
ncbi:MAG: HI0074 family nucleotidyltransferase substrate-binding subunit [Dehalococcoidia bacterium]